MLSEGEKNDSCDERWRDETVHELGLESTLRNPGRPLREEEAVDEDYNTNPVPFSSSDSEF